MKYDPFVIDMLKKAEEEKLQANFEKAIEILQKVILDTPDCFEAYEEIGDNYLSLRQLNKAEKAFKQALKINPDSSNAHYLLGFLCSIQQRWDDSVKELSRADELFPNHPEILRCLGWSYYNQNRKSERGIALLERSRNLAPQDLNVLCDLGVCYMNVAQFEKAIPIFKQVIDLNPHSDQARECEMFLKILKSSRLDT